ncbi:jg12402 [Pararge aegeria aegeria]|uniref:Jg12402 protein n=1 Tax=Pararge aegeria aegeria TaxID=348720 RepID=A0A8S4SDX2_9NEOP|nr:jg12402 [Pararge aegeria aegeria]
MKNHFVLLLLTFTGISMAVSSQKQGQIYCGRRLASVLAYICDSNFNKRSQEGITDTQLRQENRLGFRWVGISPPRTQRFGGTWRKRQVVSECCHQPCTVDELLAYCGN